MQRQRARRKKRIAGRGPGIEEVRANVAGVDLGSREHWVCGPRGDSEAPNVRQYGTTTRELEALVLWLQAEGVKSVAMESTSVYWIPLYDLLESNGIEAVLVNTRHLSRVPGRKSDMRDCQWLQQLHSCGLLHGSFRPDESVCRLRALSREHANLVKERTRIVQRMQKALDQMNVQVHHAVSDLTGKTGLAIVRAIVAGERDAGELAKLRDARCQKSVAEIEQCLIGTWRDEHLFNLRMGLRRYDEINEIIAQYEAQLQQWVAETAPSERRESAIPPHPNPAKGASIRRHGEQDRRELLWRWAGADLTRIDAIGVTVAECVLTEVGTDLTRFPDEHHFASWLRLSPRRDTSAGKPLPRRNGTGASRIATVLRVAASTLARSNTALGAYYRRVSRRKGAAIAILATARKLAHLVFRSLRYGDDYIDEGATAYEGRFRESRLRSLSNSARELGFSLTPLQSPI